MARVLLPRGVLSDTGSAAPDVDGTIELVVALSMYVNQRPVRPSVAQIHPVPDSISSMSGPLQPPVPVAPPEPVLPPVPMMPPEPVLPPVPTTPPEPTMPPEPAVETSG